MGNPRIDDVEFHWVGLDPGDATAESQIFTRYGETDVMTLDDVRAELGLDPHSNGFGRLPRSVIELAKINPFAFIDMAEMNEDERNLLMPVLLPQPTGPGEPEEQVLRTAIRLQCLLLPLHLGTHCLKSCTFGFPPAPYSSPPALSSKIRSENDEEANIHDLDETIV